MLPLLLIGLLMLGSDKVHVRYILPLALMGLTMADEIWVRQWSQMR